MTESYNHGLSELGQRMQSMSEPVDGVRLRPYQGGSQPSGSAVVERPAPAPASSPSWLNSYTAVPAPPEPYHDPVPQTTHANGNGSSHGAGYAPAPAAPKAAPAAAAPGQQPALPSSTASSEDPNAPKTGLQRAISAIRSTLPLVQRLLPLIDGNFATVLSSLVLPQSAQHHPAPPPPAPVVQVDLEPVERGLAEVRASHQELHNQVQEQTASIKRVEDQLEHVREATDRNTLEQQELVEDLRAVGGRISTFAIIGLVLLTISLGLNVYLLIQLQHILR